VVFPASIFGYYRSQRSCHFELTSRTVGAFQGTWEYCCRVWGHLGHLHGGVRGVWKYLGPPVKLTISNKPSFCQEHQGVSDGPEGSDGTSWPLTENQTRPVAQATGRVAYLPCGGYYTMPLVLAMHRVVYYAHRPDVRLPFLCVWNVGT